LGTLGDGLQASWRTGEMAMTMVALDDQSVLQQRPLSRSAQKPNDITSLILSCNKDGMEALKNGEHKAAFEQFKYAEAILLSKQSDSDQSLLAVTCNNLGCYYKKVGKFHGALSYLRQALKLEVELGTDEVTLAGTHLNLCAVLSKLEKHPKAVQHALCALEMMSQRVEAADVASNEDYKVLAIAYHNIGMEREMLQQWDQATTAFQTGYQVAKRFLGESHPLSLTLDKNCELAVKRSRAHKSKAMDKVRGGSGPEPQVHDKTPKTDGSLSSLRGTAVSIRAEAAEWVHSEAAMWNAFANKVLRDVPAPQLQVTQRHDSDALGSPAARTLPPLQGVSPKPSGMLEHRTNRTLCEIEPTTNELPKAHDMANYRFSMLKENPRKPYLKETAMGQAMEDHPEALMDILDAGGDNRASIRGCAADMRPNRSMKRSTRTSKVVRRTGVFNSTANRDRVMGEIEKRRERQKKPWKSAQTQQLAATKIQQTWRSWYTYCQENSEYMTMTWICATIIQSHWRSYYVRRAEKDRRATEIQRVIRGFLVRRVLKKHASAVAIQRHVVGMLTRMKLSHYHTSCIKMQRLVRGGLERTHVRELRSYKMQTATIIQKHVRAWLAKRRVAKLRHLRNDRLMLRHATITVQRLFRGWKGRVEYEVIKADVLAGRSRHAAALRIQSAVRIMQAVARAKRLREARFSAMTGAATWLQKVWLGTQTRKKYKALQREYLSATPEVKTIQRYTRGFLCRLKLWKDAVRSEEELWAASEIQRCWRGYWGRVLYESAYEEQWRREMGAALIQRNVRGFLARQRVRRMRRKMARSIFELARSRFRAAQKIQALARGVSTRKVTNAQRRRGYVAATEIQRIFRGHALRRRLWSQVAHQRATLIAALFRGFIVRRRRCHLVRKVVRIQRAYRRWLLKGEAHRAKRFEDTRHRKQQAVVIQTFYRQFAEKKQIGRIRRDAMQSL